ncbi:MAG: hypothetical protein JO240_07560 [Solirubrobacterales bacterium]|nr:hypothetical protein [Solirubrobacterales bacterium]
MVAPVLMEHFNPDVVWIPQGVPDCPGLRFEPYFLGSGLVSLILRTPDRFHGKDGAGQSTIPFALPELKHGSETTRPEKHRHASLRSIAPDPKKQDPRTVLVTRIAGLPAVVKA